MSLHCPAGICACDVVAGEIDVKNSSLSVCTLVSVYSLLLVLVPVSVLIKPVVHENV